MPAVLKDMPQGVFTAPDALLSEFLGKQKAFPDNIDKNGVPSAILCGYSGGADSSFLLMLLHSWCKISGTRLYAAHINHGIRGAEAIRDRDHCKKACDELGIELFILNADVPAIAKNSGKTLEEAARDVRYGFFSDIMKKNNIPVLATAHNGDDNIETVIFRLSRGSGLKGLAGIPPVRFLSDSERVVIRPILKASKEKILDICAKNGIKYVYDSTNSETEYTRNKIRAEVLPTLKALNPRLCETFDRSSGSLRRDCEYLDGVAAEYLDRNGADAADIKKLSELHDAVLMRVISLMYTDAGGSMAEQLHLEGIKELIRSKKEGCSISLPARIKASIKNGKLLFTNTDELPTEHAALPLTQLTEGENLLPDGLLIYVEKGKSTCSSHSTPQIQPKSENIYKLFTQVLCQSDKICGSLFVRSRLPGDKIYFGAFSKDVRDLMSEKRIPTEERISYPIICDSKGILLIPGLGQRFGSTPTGDTEEIVRITVIKTADGIE